MFWGFGVEFSARRFWGGQRLFKENIVFAASTFATELPKYPELPVPVRQKGCRAECLRVAQVFLHSISPALRPAPTTKIYCRSILQACPPPPPSPKMQGFGKVFRVFIDG